MKEKIEIWADIAGYEGLYQVSNLGQVRSYDMLVNAAYGSKQLRKGRILKPALDTNGYQQVNLYKDGKMKHYRIHRLVAHAFIPNPQNLPQVNHINECKTDNRVNNLEWCTNEYNHNYGTINERIAKALKGKPNIGVRLALSKRVAQIDKNTNEVIKIWQSVNECGRNGFNSSHISRCCRGKRKTHKGYKWQYVNDSFFSLQNCSTIDYLL